MSSSGNVEVALTNIVKQIVARYVIAHVRTHQVQQVGNLGIGFEAPAARRHHHKPTAGIGLNDCFDLLKMLSVRDRGAAELCDLYHDETITFLAAARGRQEALIPWAHTNALFKEPLT